MQSQLVGFEEAIKRGNAYLKAGADVVFVEAPGTMEQVVKIPKFIQGPVLINVSPRTPNLSFKEYENMGYRIAIYPSICFTASMMAIRKKLAELKKKRIVEQWEGESFSFEEMLDFLGLKEYQKSRRKGFGEFLGVADAAVGRVQFLRNQESGI